MAQPLILPQCILHERKNLKRFVKIRSARNSDLQTILKLVNDEAEKTSGITVLRVSPEEVGAWINSGLAYVAEFDGEIIGHVSINSWKKLRYGELRSFVVIDKYRMLGIGSLLLSQIIQDVIDYHAEIDVLIAFSMNELSRPYGIFDSLGFDKIAFSNLLLLLQKSKEGSISKKVYVKQLSLIRWSKRRWYNNGR